MALWTFILLGGVILVYVLLTINENKKKSVDNDPKKSDNHDTQKSAEKPVGFMKMEYDKGLAYSSSMMIKGFAQFATYFLVMFWHIVKFVIDTIKTKPKEKEVKAVKKDV